MNDAIEEVHHLHRWMKKRNLEVHQGIYNQCQSPHLLRKNQSSLHNRIKLLRPFRETKTSLKPTCSTYTNSLDSLYLYSLPLALTINNLYFKDEVLDLDFSSSEQATCLQVFLHKQCSLLNEKQSSLTWTPTLRAVFAIRFSFRRFLGVLFFKPRGSLLWWGLKLIMPALESKALNSWVLYKWKIPKWHQQKAVRNTLKPWTRD